MGRKPKETPPHIMRKHLLKRIHESWIRGPVGYITKIVPKIHRITLTGYISSKKIVEVLGPLKENKRYPYSNRRKSYKVMYDGKKEGFKYQVFRNPLNPHKPTTLIQINPPENVSIRKHKSFLSQLNTAFPNLNIFKVEYTIDLYCPDYTVAKALFDVLKRTLYVPWVRDPPTIYAESFSTGKMKNRTMYIDEEIIVYERGDDEDKTDEGWEEKKINRVRLENKVPRQKLQKKKIKLCKLSDLLICCKFFEVNKKIYQFKKFKGIKRLPGELQSYNADDTFLGVYIPNRKIKKIPKKNIVDVEELRPLKEELLNAMKDYDTGWESLQ